MLYTIPVESVTISCNFEIPKYMGHLASPFLPCILSWRHDLSRFLKHSDTFLHFNNVLNNNSFVKRDGARVSEIVARFPGDCSHHVRTKRSHNELLLGLIKDGARERAMEIARGGNEFHDCYSRDDWLERWVISRSYLSFLPSFFSPYFTKSRKPSRAFVRTAMVVSHGCVILVKWTIRESPIWRKIRVVRLLILSV